MNKLSKILAVLDTRTDAQPALERAVEVAGKTGAALLLFACDHLPGLSRDVFADEKETKKARDEHLAKQKAWLEELADEARERGIETETEAAWHRPRYEAVVKAATGSGAGLIVKAASDRSMPARLLMGATDWDLIRHAPQATWLVKKTGPVTGSDWIVAVDPAHPDEKHVGLDEKLLKTAKFLADPLDARLNVFHAFIPPAMVAPTGGTGGAAPALTAAPENAEEILRERKKRVRELAEPFDIAENRIEIDLGDTVLQLDRLVGKRDARLVVAGAVSRGTLERLLIGNTAESLLNQVDCDVLVVKPDDFGSKQD